MAAISNIGILYRVAHVLGKSIVAVCTDSPILGNEAESTRP